MEEQTGFRNDGLIGLPVMDLAALEGCDDTALFHALHRIMSDTQSVVSVSRFQSGVGKLESVAAGPVDDL